VPHDSLFTPVSLGELAPNNRITMDAPEWQRCAKGERLLVGVGLDKRGNGLADAFRVKAPPMAGAHEGDLANAPARKARAFVGAGDIRGEQATIRKPDQTSSVSSRV
jgi:hypothetical protein